MSITIEATAQGLFEAMQLLSPDERERFKELANAFSTPQETAEEEEADRHRISQASAARFFKRNANSLL